LEEQPVGTPGDRALTDAQRVIDRALQTHGHLLTAGEVVVARRWLALSGPPGRAWARLVGRQRAVFRPAGLAWDDVPDPAAAVAALRRAGLVAGGVSWDARLPLFTVPELKEGCAALGLPAKGRRADLEARLTGQAGWSREQVLRICDRPLLRRLELLAFASPGRDRSALLLERLGVMRWVDYPLAPGAPLFRDRRALRELLVAMSEADPGEPEDWLALVEAAAPRPLWLRRLDPRRWRIGRVAEAARGLERAGELERAEALYRRLLAAGLRHPGPVAQRLALVLERLERAGEGASICDRWRQRADPEDAPALERTGRRLAKKAGGAWRPARPLTKPPVRALRLPRGRALGHRPGWGDPPLPVEQAVVRALAPRRALHGENALWTTLFGLTLEELLWLPVPGMLPARYLSGPLDLGTPAFAEQRRAAFEAALEDVRGGGAPARIAAAWEARHGARVRGVAWELTDLATLQDAARGLGAAVLERVLRRLGEEGWGAARGLPDLLVLPGPPTRLDGVPATVGPGALLAEIKGPGDTLRDAQKVWLDQLRDAGAAVEIWSVAAG
jgi:hypothetical protein